MDLAELNEVAQRTFLKKKRWDELEENKHYFISAIKQVQTRYGKKTVLEVDNSFQLFLPARMNDFLEKKPQKLEELLDTVQKMKLYIYHFQKGAFEFKID